MTQSLAERIALALGGVERQPGSWTACCPYHDDSKPSLSITDGDGGRPLLFCHAGCDYEDVIATIEARGILAEDWQDSLPPAAPRPPPKPPEPNADAMKLWREASPIKAGGIVDRYLKGRGITIDAPVSLRETSIRVGRAWVPAMLAVIQIPVEGEEFGKLITIQKTLLNVRQDNSVYRGERLNATGPLGNGAVRLAKAGNVLGIAGGVETALSAMQLTGIPVWACLGSQRMARVAIPESVRELHIFGDDDVSGRKAVQATIDAHRDRIEVHWHYPPEGFGDWNNALTEHYQPRGINDWRDIHAEQAQQEDSTMSNESKLRPDRYAHYKNGFEHGSYCADYLAQQPEGFMMLPEHPIAEYVIGFEDGLKSKGCCVLDWNVTPKEIEEKAPAAIFVVKRPIS